ncbi:unnamed protein product [Rotaria socialis]|nr:unnamed protein product [Rotaria socialis]CAF3292287.1 unnamed protein product [Rotaria socialis]CAF3327261.1 unnamed protein product [Rotaria socialis]CAF3331356.1 unnamed protein product [Rotaria socialis]CAF4473142.1 unnamed protein product [Rotaria socialis]
MSRIVYDWDAPDLRSANQNVIKVMIQYLENYGDGIITNAAQKFIINKLQTYTPFCNFYQDIERGIVQVDAEFEGTINKETSIFRIGHKWKVRFTIDADIPPPGSTQKKHIGFEIHIKSKSKQAGHAWCNAVPRGRPSTNERMRETETTPITETFPNTDTITYSFTTHALN